ncbi:MAG: hypothetical protein AB7F88_06530 [Pyrinomonadaceae bacterium]
MKDLRFSFEREAGLIAIIHFGMLGLGLAVAAILWLLGALD